MMTGRLYPVRHTSQLNSPSWQKYPIWSIFQLAASLSFNNFSSRHISPARRWLLSQLCSYLMSWWGYFPQNSWNINYGKLFPNESILHMHYTYKGYFSHLARILKNIVGGLKAASLYRSASWTDIPAGRWWFICWLTGRIIAHFFLAVPNSKFPYWIGNRICISMVGSCQLNHEGRGFRSHKSKVYKYNAFDWAAAHGEYILA